jgi:hypothetical protein
MPVVISLLVFGCALKYRSPTQIRTVNATLPPPLSLYSASPTRRSSATSTRSNSPTRPLAPGGGENSYSYGGEGIGSPKIPIKFFWTTVMVPDNSRFRMALFSRVVAMVPFLIECEFWALMWVDTGSSPRPDGMGFQADLGAHPRNRTVTLCTRPRERAWR